jgi:glycosyltransferase involved in cell wall biosynthesis
MRISFNTSPGNLSMNTGYGLAGYHTVVSLQALGHDVRFKDPSAPVELAFCMPDFSEWSSPKAYHIQYTPWESTELKDGWLEAFNENCDEVWTTSPLIREWYIKAGVKEPISIFEHGVDHEWSPHRRKHSGKMKFLHIGEPAPRKGGQVTMDAFADTFGNNPDYSLTIKGWNRSWIRAKRPDGSIAPPQELYNNIHTVYNTLEVEQMRSMVKAHNVLVYPSWGEGFGLIPLEAMATGMPVIMTDHWAPYKRFILPELIVESRLAKSPWPEMHPGMMFEPSYDSLVKGFKTAAEDYDRLAGRAYRNAFKIHEEYDWVKQTEKAIAPIVERFG